MGQDRDVWKVLRLLEKAQVSLALAQGDGEIVAEMHGKSGLSYWSV